ncbi:variable charge X-linked protein 1-like [Salvia divinorum]|uniref:Variable charge X-linked protein 1-like n=2 Tax=Salvia divinorum TaxID=28513 RepID=A0ABD1IHQ6_SALDI
MVFVADYLTIWRDAHECGITHCEGIVRLIDSLPVPWNKWADDASQPYLWYGLPNYVVQGDMHGFVKILLEALVDARGGRPPYAAPRGVSSAVHQGLYSRGRFESETPRPNFPKRRRLGMRTSAPSETEALFVDRYVDMATYVGENTEEDEEEEEKEEEEEEDPLEDDEDPIEEGGDPVEEEEPLEEGTEVGNEDTANVERAPEE